jgi:proline iminopeptidase
MRWHSLVIAAVMATFMALGGFVSSAHAENRPAAAISDGEFVKIGGIDQWIGIHGDDQANPVIVVVHGGPAEAQTPLEQFYTGWYKNFTVVQWDQRDAGKTFGRNGKSTPDMTLHRMIQDGIEVAEYARRRLSKDKVIILGHSWGAYLGVNMIKKRPDLFYAYVGTGQVVSWSQKMAVHYAYAMKRAEAEGNQDALRELREIGPPPHEFGPKFFTAQKWLNHYLADSDTKYLQKQLDIVRAAPNFSPQDVQDWIAGGQFTIPLLFPTLTAIDLPATQGYDMRVPFYIIQGQEDHITPTSVAQDYFRKIRAPRKKMVLIKNVGHFAYVTNPEGFVAALVKYVRPQAAASH